MMFISFDRSSSIFAIFYPLRENLFQKPKILSAIICVLSIVLMIPYVLMFQVEYRTAEGTYYCLQVWPWADQNDLTPEETYRVLKTFHIVVFISLYVLHLCVAVTNYSLICRKIWVRQIPRNVSDSNRANAANLSARWYVCWWPYAWCLRCAGFQSMSISTFGTCSLINHTYYQLKLRSFLLG